MYFWSSLASRASCLARMRALRSSFFFSLSSLRRCFSAAFSASLASSSAQRASRRAMRAALRSSASLMNSSSGAEAARLSATANESDAARLSAGARESTPATRESDVACESAFISSACSASLRRCSARRFRLSAASRPSYRFCIMPGKKRSVCMNSGRGMDS